MIFNKTLAGLALVACVGAAAPASAQVYLGNTLDRCSSQLSVQSVNGWMRVNRGDWVSYEPVISSHGYWYWRCGGSNERSRISRTVRPNLILMKHYTFGRLIQWEAYRR